MRAKSVPPARHAQEPLNYPDSHHSVLALQGHSTSHMSCTCISTPVGFPTPPTVPARPLAGRGLCGRPQHPGGNQAAALCF